MEGLGGGGGDGDGLLLDSRLEMKLGGDMMKRASGLVAVDVCMYKYIHFMLRCRHTVLRSDHRRSMRMKDATCIPVPTGYRVLTSFLLWR